MGRIKFVHTRSNLLKPIDIMRKKLVFVLLYHRIEPMTKVMKEDAHDGQTTQGRTFSPRQKVVKMIFHGNNIVGFISFSLLLTHVHVQRHAAYHSRPRV